MENLFLRGVVDVNIAGEELLLGADDELREVAVDAVEGDARVEVEECWSLEGRVVIGLLNLLLELLLVKNGFLAVEFIADDPELVLHLIAGEGAGFVAEDVLDLPEFFVDLAGDGLDAPPRFFVAELLVGFDHFALDHFYDFE